MINEKLGYCFLSVSADQVISHTELDPRITYLMSCDLISGDTSFTDQESLRIDHYDDVCANN
jgi:hypothetical protein